MTKKQKLKLKFILEALEDCGVMFVLGIEGIGTSYIGADQVIALYENTDKFMADWNGLTERQWLAWKNDPNPRRPSLDKYRLNLYEDNR